MSVCVYHNISPSRINYFVGTRLYYLYGTPAPSTGHPPVSVVMSRGSGATSNLCVSTDNSREDFKFEWIL
jgi:hypothetical protein